MSNSAAVVDQVPQIKSLFAAYEKTLDPSITAFTSSIPETFEALIGKVSSDITAVNDNVLSNRLTMKPIIEAFHRQADTLTPGVSDSMDLLADPATRIIVSAHQPNLFAYGGVMKKIVLLECAKDKTMDTKFNKIVNLFLVIDHDFADETWVRVAQLPSARHSSGIMELRVPVPESEKWRMVCNVPLPSKAIVNQWKHRIKSWVRDCTRPDSEVRKKAGLNFEEFWQAVVEPAYSRARSYSDLNSFMLSRLVNVVWGYNTIFVRISQLSRVFENGFAFLLSNFGIYSEALRAVESRLMSTGIDTGVGNSSFHNAPVWAHCACGSKASAKIIKLGNNIHLSGPCISCHRMIDFDLGTQEDLDLGKAIEKLSPRAIPIPLLLARDLGVTCYASGTGGLGYLVDGSVVAKKLATRFPLVAVWSSKDGYRGIGQYKLMSSDGVREQTLESRVAWLEKSAQICRESILPLLTKRRKYVEEGRSIEKLLSQLFLLKEQQRKIRREIDVLNRLRNISRMSPCFVDYAVNFGMRRTEQIWRSHLFDDGRLASPVIFQ